MTVLWEVVVVEVEGGVVLELEAVDLLVVPVPVVEVLPVVEVPVLVVDEEEEEPVMKVSPTENWPVFE